MPTRNVSAEEAAHLLKDVSEEWKAFWFNHGLVAKNLAELAAALGSTTAEQFAHHVNSEKNDVAAWVDEVLGDATLAAKLRLLTSPEAAQRMVARRVEELTATASPAASTETIAPAAAKRAAKKPAAKKSSRKGPASKAEKSPAVSSPVTRKESVWSKLLKR